MKTRTTVILLLITIGLGVWIKFFESKGPNTEEAHREAGNVINFDREKLEGIVIQNGDDRIELRREGGKWRLTQPVKDQADSSVVDNLISDLESWRREAVVPAAEVAKEKARLNEYGLVQPKLRLRLIGPGAPPEIFFGKDAALENKMYIRFVTGKDVFITSQTVRTDIARKPNDFRDRKLTDLITAQVIRAILKTSAGEIELVKKDEHWGILKPLQARAADDKVNDLLAQVTNAHIEEFVGDDKGDLHAYGLSEPRGSLTFFGGDDKQGRTLQIGSAAEKTKDTVYVRYLPRNAVYTVTKKTEDILNTKPNDLRDRHLVRIDTNNLDRVNIEDMGQPKIVLARKDQDWTIASRKNEPANGDEVRRLLETLNAEQITRFVADTATELPKYGLDHPQLQLTFSSFASENTAETAAGEHPFLTLAFGKVEGNEVYARIGEEPFVVAVNRELLDKIWTDPLRWQELAIFKLKPDQIHRVSRVTDQEESLERDGKNWKWIQGKGEIDPVNVRSLLNTLSSLRAVRWAGATTPSQGFDKPLLVLTFTTSPNDKTIHKLTVGAATQESMWYAKTDEREGAFIISQPDLNALKLPLTKIAAASPASSPTPNASPAASITP